jgi:hypothetical protein
MTAIAALPHINPTSYPIFQLFKDLSAELPSYFKRTDETFCRVYVNKLDEQGNPRIINRTTDLDTGEVTPTGPEFCFIENIHNGQIYLDEPGFVIAVKCALVFFAVPLFTAGTMLWHVHQIFRSIGLIARNVFNTARRDFVLGRYFEAAQILDREIKPLPGILKERILAIIKAPFFGLGLEIAALAGMIRPLHGREYVGMILKAWHNGATYKNNICKVLLREKDINYTTLSRDIHSGDEFFLAYCFLDRGNVKTDPRFKVLCHGPIGSYFES